MIEAQVAYIIQAMKTAGQRSIEVREGVEARYNERIQRRLANMAWSRIDDSWYLSGGMVTNNWPGGCGEYRRALGTFRAEEYRLGT